VVDRWKSTHHVAAVADGGVAVQLVGGVHHAGGSEEVTQRG